MLKEGFLKIFVVFITSFFVYYLFFLLSASYGNSNKFFTQSYKNIWNDSYIKNDIKKISELYKDAKGSVVKNKQVCVKEGFYFEDGNNYFCKDGVVFIFSSKKYIDSIYDTLIKSGINLLILSIFFAFINLISLYLYNSYFFKVLKNKSVTLQEIDKKLSENSELYKAYISDVQNFDNNPYKNNIRLFNTVYAYYLISKRHINNILNKLNEINRLIYIKGLFFLSHDFFKKQILFNEYIKINSNKYNFLLFNIKNIFFQNTIFGLFKILFFLLIINYLILNDVSYTTGLFNFFSYLNLKEVFLMLGSSGGVEKETLITFLIGKIGLFIILYNIIIYIKNK